MVVQGTTLCVRWLVQFLAFVSEGNGGRGREIDGGGYKSMGGSRYADGGPDGACDMWTSLDVLAALAPDSSAYYTCPFSAPCAQRSVSDLPVCFHQNDLSPFSALCRLASRQDE